MPLRPKPLSDVTSELTDRRSPPRVHLGGDESGATNDARQEGGPVRPSLHLPLVLSLSTRFRARAGLVAVASCLRAGPFCLLGARICQMMCAVCVLCPCWGRSFCLAREYMPWGWGWLPVSACLSPGKHLGYSTSRAVSGTDSTVEGRDGEAEAFGHFPWAVFLGIREGGQAALGACLYMSWTIAASVLRLPGTIRSLTPSHETRPSRPRDGSRQMAAMATDCLLIGCAARTTSDSW
jgi:hypothetical protein